MTYTVTNLSQERRYTPREWLGVGQSVSDLANQWAERGDILAYVGEGAGHGAPACFYHPTAELELDVEKAFGPLDPETIGPLTDRRVRYEHPRAVGLIAHEAFHARFTLYDKVRASSELTPKEFEALGLLEESRIEAQGITYEPKTRNFLRVAVRDLILPETIYSLSSVDGLASLVALIAGRVQAGILEKREVSLLLDIAQEALGEKLYSDLLSVVRRAQGHIYHRDHRDLCDLAREWESLLKEKRGDAGEGEGPTELSEALAPALEEALAEIEVQAMADLMDQSMSEDQTEASEQRAKESKEHRQNESVSEDVFSKGTTDMEHTGTNSRLIEMRAPSGEERVAAVTIARELEKAKYHDRVELEMSHEAPPGRLKTRAMVQAQALKSKGVRSKVEPWRRTTRKHAIDPSLTVGVMVDISGSMHSAMEPMATTAWVMSEATRRVQGRTAMVYFGQDVFPTLKPGEHLQDVRVYSAADGTERFDKAFRALDGALNLLGGQGARLLVVASDANYCHEEILRARHWVTRCAEEGVAVLWLPYDQGSSVRYTLEGAGSSSVMIVPGTLKPEQTALEIGRAASLALTRAGQ